jgi:hypothetical protein
MSDKIIEKLVDILEELDEADEQICAANLQLVIDKLSGSGAKAKIER